MTVSTLLADLASRGVEIRAEGDRLQLNAPVGALTPGLRQELQQHKAAILEFLRGPTELSFAQQRLWFVDQIAPGDGAYTVAGALEMRGALDTSMLERALGAVVNRHESLRTVFVSVEGEPRQVVAEPGPWSLPVADLSGEADARERLKGLLSEEIARGFDLARGPLFRAQLYRLAPDTHVLQLSMHHIVSDGWSMGVLTRELSALYGAYARGEAPVLPALPAQYRDFARWQRGWLQGEVLARELAHWRERLAGAPQVLELPTDRARPAIESHRGAFHSFVLPLELMERLQGLSQREGATLFMTLLSGFALLLSRYSNQQDLLIGTPVANRNRAEIEGLIGFFVNTLVLRADTSGEPTVREFIGRMREACLDAYAHQDLPFERLVEELHPARDMSRNPVFQVMFVLQSATRGAALKLPGLTLKPVGASMSTAKFDLTLEVQETAAGLIGIFEYATDLFDESTIVRMGTHWRALLEAMVATPERRVAELPLLSEPERRQLLVKWNETKTRYPSEASIAELFETQAKRTPQAVALEYEGKTLTYRELNAQANQLARYLRKQGVKAQTLVGLCVERSPEMVVATLAILKTGGAYVPLDPEYPKERLAFMLQDTEAPVLLTQSGLRERLPAYAGRVIELDSEWKKVAGEGAVNPKAQATAQSLAYVIYTSGSTGRPKGTLVEQRSVVRLVQNTNFIELGPKEVFLQFAPISFDASTLELWGPLLNGGRLVVAPPGRLALEELARLIKERGVTTLWLTAALFHQMVDSHIEALRGVRQLLAGGETLSVPHVRRFLEGIGANRLINGYGPTENTTFTCCHVMTADARIEHTVPIGRPISNTRVYILDAHRQPVPVGVFGELYIGGAGLARGYLNQPELTEEKFVADPFNRGERLYRTGDLVRYTGGGVIEFLGRVDTQVKVRGYRIELGEIEYVLSEHPGVREVVVLAREDSPGDKRLVAYVVGEVDAGALKERLAGALPHYMVPSAFVTLEALPLTPAGKVDRRALPAPEYAGAEHVAPQSDLEQRIAAVWREMLKREQVGIRDNFFELGGHSLLLMKTHARLCAELKCEIKVVDLFAHPTVEALARHLGGEAPGGALAERALARVKRRHAATGQAEPIAIIGMAGRFPGALDIESFWKNLRAGTESISFFSREEMRESGVPAPLLSDPNYVGARGYLEDADRFDAAFFGYSARNAENIDPQQRVLLECAADLLERAGYDPERYEGLIGVYAGSSADDYGPRTLGDSRDFLTTRISYKLNLRGPSVNVQTACSTSLVAVHYACRALWDHECDMALAGGVSVTTPLKSGYLYMEEGIASADGHCRAFDAGASGAVGGNGVAMVQLKRLSQALADGDHVHAVIRGSAINNDGSAKVGYTAPSVEGEAQAIALAQAAAECDPDTIGYVEAHGTGTLLGDPIEIEALTRVFGAGRARRVPCWIGSVKTNVGHLDAAAGVTGLIKAALSLEHRELVPSLNFRQPNPKIDFASGPFKVNTELRAWQSSEGAPRRAGVSSFGFGGTNAHAVLEEAPQRQPSVPAQGWQLLCLSAKTEAALAQVKANLARHLKEHPEVNLADVAYTLQVGRREFAHRCVVACREPAEAARALEANDRVIGGVHKDANRSVVFMFSGQGAQYPNMGLGLYRTEAVFREAVDGCCERLKGPLGLDLREVLYPAEGGLEQAVGRLKRTELTQPALFVVEYALARLWMSLGVEPAAMIGHSVGEYVAACLAGVMSLEDALDLVAERGRLMGRLPAGAMLAVGLPEAELLTLLGERLSVAAVNGPQLCVVSGPEPDVATLENKLTQRGLTPRRLHTSHAFHSVMMEPILEAFMKRVSAVRLSAPRLPYISNVSGEWITADQATDPAYYATHLRRAVRFSQGLERLFLDPSRVLLEVGPGQTLVGLARRHPGKKEEHAFVGSLRHPDESRADDALFMESVGRLWLAGARADWAKLHAGHRRRRVRLPTYPFERKRYWISQSQLLPGPERLQRKADPREWVYFPSWKRAPVPQTGPNKRGVNWLLFVDQGGLGAQIEADLTGAGSRVVSVEVGESFAARGPGKYVLNPRVRENYDRLLAELKANAFTPEFIAHLWTVRRDGELLKDEDFRVECQNRGFFSVVYLAQALETFGLNAPIGLAVLTSHVHEVDGRERICPENAMVLGPCKVIGMEQPHIRVRSIDLAVDGDLQWLGRTLANDLCAPWTEPVVAYRGRYRWAQSFEQVDVPNHVPPTLVRDAGAYLIAGGLGIVGLAIAEFLARTGRARLVLVSRTGLPERGRWMPWLAEHDEGDATARIIRRVQAIESLGAEVLICKADVADESRMREVIAEAEARFGPLRGVVHAAAAEKRFLPIRALQRADCEAQFRPRLEGLRVLQNVLRGKRLDFCLVNSSLASVMGLMDFAAYTASQLFLDAFVHQHNKEESTQWKVVNWDGWMAEEPAAASPALPMFYMRSGEATDVLSRFLSMADATQILVSTGDLQGRIDRVMRREKPQANGTAEAAPISKAHPRGELSTEYEAPRTEIEHVLAGIWQEMLGIDKVGIHDNFFELGGDSLLNIALTARVNRAGVRMTPKQIFQHQTIAELAAIVGNPTETRIGVSDGIKLLGRLG